MRKKPIFTLSIIGLTLPLMLGGCVSLLPKPGKPPLVAPFSAAKNISIRENIGKSIIVDAPLMPRSLATNEIMVNLPDGSLAYVDGLNLIAPAPKAIQNLLIETFDKSLAFKLVGRETTTLRADYFLAIDVTRFDVTEPGWRKPGHANVTISARLINYYDRTAIANKVFEIDTIAKKGSAIEPAIALQNATQIAADQILDWVLEQNQSKEASASK
ncbi:MAG: membrane integrity-associated transporter subunit PqiC [Caulobacterales bacterium]|nr:membrane integrity-associated transporter subunit PqiC [Caulobacterales bacterium]MCA0373233.1 ABC-type transport auxiliary lipoprotein family protein [Pseudomonadota bacterium]